MAHPYWPLFDLSVRTPRLELRYPDDDLVCRLVALAEQGIHDPGWMPFGIAWTDQESPARERESMKHYWASRANHTPEKWDMPLAVLVDGEPVGVQACHADNFAKLRQAETGSWLGLAHQGKGIGKEMRAAVLHFLFEGLGAQRCLSGAWHDNGPIVTICNSGPRAAIAASILRARGLDARPVVDGGMEDWLARGATAVTFRRCGSG